MPIAQLHQENSIANENAKTFIFTNEGHTLGNALRCIISSYNDVEFCGYTVPHPAEDSMHFRIQMREGQAVEALKKGLEDLVKMCDHTLKVYDNELLAFQSKQMSL